MTTYKDDAVRCALLLLTNVKEHTTNSAKCPLCFGVQRTDEPEGPHSPSCPVVLAQSVVARSAGSAESEAPVAFYPAGYTQPPGWYYEMVTGTFNGPFATQAEATMVRDLGVRAYQRLEEFKARRAAAATQPGTDKVPS